MKLSVIIPVFNARRYLKESLLSVLNQRFDGDMEIIAVDDGSTDGSLTVLEDFSHSFSQLRIIRQGNRGPGAARNIALREATGEWVLFLDADDRLQPNALRELMLATDKDVTMVAGRIVRTSKESLRLNDKETVIKEIDGESATILVLYQRWFPYSSSLGGKLFRRELFNGLSFQEDGRYEDLDIVPRLMMKCRKIALTNAIVYFYRESPDGFLRNWSASRGDVLDVMASLKNDRAFSKEIFRKALTDREFSAAMNLLLLTDVYKREDANVVAQCRHIIKNNRCSVLFNGNSRMKNRLGAAATYFGLTFVKFLNGIFGIVKH